MKKNKNIPIILISLWCAIEFIISPYPYYGKNNQVFPTVNVGALSFKGTGGNSGNGVAAGFVYVKSDGEYCATGIGAVGTPFCTFQDISNGELYAGIVKNEDGLWVCSNGVDGVNIGSSGGNDGDGDGDGDGRG